MNTQLSLYDSLDFKVGDKVFFVSLDNIFKAKITAIGKRIEWIYKDGDCYCAVDAASQYLFKSRTHAKDKVTQYKKQFKGGK